MLFIVLREIKKGGKKEYTMPSLNSLQRY